MDEVLTIGKLKIQIQTQKIVQEFLDNYGCGIQVLTKSFKDVINAHADMDKFISEAHAYKNMILPQARGEAEALIKSAEAYRENKINRALGGYQFLILTKDDYSMLFVAAQLIDRDGSFEHLQVARRTVERYGRALASYVDQHSIIRFVGHHGVHVRYLVGLDEREIQFRRAFRSTDIGLIYARKGAAEAKGKVEKAFNHLQRRVPYL